MVCRCTGYNAIVGEIMDIRIMQYFLAVIREGTISAASEALHVAQPSLSRQMKDLEEELGATLFIRGSRSITLTEEGKILRKRAEEMVQLMQKTEDEISQVRQKISGTIRIGAGETRVFHYLSETASVLTKDYPGIRISIKSGDTDDLMDEIGTGLLDFAVIFTEPDTAVYHSLVLPAEDTYGILMRKDSPYAGREKISLWDLKDEPFIISRGALRHFQEDEKLSKLNIRATYNLIYNASLLVEDRTGYAICFDHLINTSGDSALTFVPLTPEKSVRATLIWKKYQVLSPAVQLFVDKIRELISGKSENHDPAV